MTPAFSTWNAFWAMGGYGFFVWLAVCCTLISLCGIVLHTFLQRRRLLADIRQRQRRENRIRMAKKRAGKAAGEQQ